MKENVLITILTPTYNRLKYLPRVFESLCKQTNTDFEWLIIDDGSTDDTEEYIKTLQHKFFRIIYKKKENSGKHTALNYAHPYINGKLVLILDSDDWLTEDAVEVIKNDWEKYQDNNTICGFSYKKEDVSGKVLTKKAINDYFLSTHFEWRINAEIKGDCCEVLKKEILLAYPFPEFEGERFMSEGWLWNHVALNYKTVYRNKTIYICEYLEEGLSKTGRKLRMQCPLGMMENCKSFFVKQVRWKIQIKEMLLFWVYGLCAKMRFREIVRASGKGLNMILVAPFGMVLCAVWKRKYG